MVQVVKGRDVAVTFDAKRCIHSRRCVLGRPDVFAAGAGRDWLNPDAAPAEAVLHIGRICPSGAIRVARNDGTETAEAPPLVNTLRVLENGPLAIEAELSLRGSPRRAPSCAAAASRNRNPSATAAMPRPASPPPASRRRATASRWRPAPGRWTCGRRRAGP